jgi:hypothetical protein
MGQDGDHNVSNFRQADTGSSWRPQLATKELRCKFPLRSPAFANLRFNLHFPMQRSCSLRHAHDRVKLPHNLADFRRIFQPFAPNSDGITSLYICPSLVGNWVM